MTSRERGIRITAEYARGDAFAGRITGDLVGARGDISFTRAAPTLTQPKLSVTMISAWDCPPCEVWKRKHAPVMQAHPAFAHVEFREVVVYSFREINYKPRWPEDLHWLQARIQRKGAPRFVIHDGQDILMNVAGNKRWRRHSWPLAKRLVAHHNADQR